MTSPDDAPHPRLHQRLARWAVGRAGALLISFAFVALALRQAPGRIVADTKLDLALDPVGFLSGARDMWDPSAWFGFVPNQLAGYWFPMGPFFVVGHTLGVPPWITQRAWLAGLLVVAFWGTLWLLEELEIGSRASRLGGALTYAVSPSVLLLIGHQSATLLPAALLPLALLPLVRGADQGSPRRAAAWSALAVAAMGGTNGVATGLVLVVPLLFLLTRSPGPRRRSLLGHWLVFVPLVTLWWWGPLLLQGRYGIDFTRYTEQAAATTASLSLTEILRGAGVWTARLEIRNQPWIPAGVLLTGSAVVVTATALLSGLGLAGLAHPRLRERRFLISVLAVGTVSMAVAYGFRGGSPFASVADDLLDGALSPLRNLHKFAPLIALPLACGIAHGLALLGAAVDRRTMDRPPRTRRVATAGAATGVAVLVVIGAFPMITGDLPRAGSFEDIPVYWRDAARWLEDHDDAEGRTLILPAATFAEYSWGRTFDEPLQAIADTPWAVRNIIPLGGDASTRLLDEIEDRLEDGGGSTALATVLARSGVGRILVRNDLDPRRSNSSEPRFVHTALAASPGLRRVAQFGPVVEAPFSRERLTSSLGAPESPVQAVEIWEVDDPAPRVQLLPAEGMLVTVGGPESALSLAEAGVLGNRTMTLAADGAPPIESAEQAVLTDDARRRDNDYGQVHDAESYTLAAEEGSLPHDQPPRVRGLPEHSSLASVAYEGIRSVSASSYYTGYARVPGAGPAAAVDGSVTSAWYPAGYQDIEGEFVDIDLIVPTELGQVTVLLPPIVPGRGQLTDAVVETDQGQVPVSFELGQDRARVNLPPGPTRSVRVVLTGALQTLTDLFPPGIAEIQMGSIEATRAIVVPPYRGDPVGTPEVVVLQRERADPLEATEFDEDPTLERRVTLTGGGDYQVRGRVMPIPGPDLLELDERLRPESDPSASASSVWGGAPAFSGAAAVDGDTSTAWLAGETDAEPTLDLHFAIETLVDHVEVDLPPEPVHQTRRIRLDGDDGQHRDVPLVDGVATFPPMTTRNLAVSFPAVTRVGPGFVDLLGISELRVGPSNATSAPTDHAYPVRMPCGEGPPLEIDGQSLPTAVNGTGADLVALQPLALTVCGDVALSDGSVAVSGGAVDGLQIDGLVLEPTGYQPEVPLSRDLAVDQWAPERRVVTVGDGDEAVLALTENDNAGWVARLDGHELDPLSVDGWRQGWVVPAGAGGSVVVTFAPGTWYDRALVTGVALVVLVLVIALATGRRSTAAPARARSLGSRAILAIATVALFLVAGPLALVVPVLWLLRERRLLLPLVAGVAMTTAGLLAAFDLGPANATGLPGQFLAGLAVAAVLVSAAQPDPADGPPAGSRAQQGADDAG